MIQVGGSQQVMLEVKVAEISRTLVNRLDINFTAFNDGGTFKIGTAGAGTTSPIGNDWSTYVPPFTSQGQAIFMNSLRGGFLFNAVIDAAKSNGLAKVLAEPNLTTLSGQEAKFLAGGEFPIPVAQDDGAITIEYKEYGVGLNFVPYVLDSGVISLKVNVIVSELAGQNSYAVGSLTQTAYTLNKRSANSTVEVRTGETIAIAGLINESLRENVSRFPGLGDLALLGTLFRSQDFIKGQTELVIFVTPRLATSFDPQLVRLPTDSFVEPNDREFYLMGRLDACRNRKDQSLFACGGALGPDISGSEGHFGHDL
jgi:pilus assembly protein CpaC